MSNHLAYESSPYLLQHADNPVDWYPWGEEALRRARAEDKPIFLSIGYTACHWCHVMAHESFEDPAIADLMNANFINIKVDREERPDIDSIYMSFIVSTTGSGGWPMSVFLTPEGKPFYGGTYFPPVRQHNLPAFHEVLERVASVWQSERAAILSSSETITDSLRSQPAVIASNATLEAAQLDQVVQTISHRYDWQNGGWGGAPRFPQPMLIEFLLAQAARGSQASLEMAVHVLRSMAQGGMYDLLGGGFARYSVDDTWLVPHFEKMLYDNAQLARAYLHAYQLTGNVSFSEICQSTLDFILRELAHPAGGFFSSLDADSEGQEGFYYVWSAKEIRRAFTNPQDSELFMTAYGVTGAGNFEGRNILRRALPDEQLALQFNLQVSSISARLARLRAQLLEVRSRRVHPATDTKVLVAWNALALAAFAEASRALGRQDYLAAAISNADFILRNMLLDGRLHRSWRDGVAKYSAYLEDYAGLGLALLALYQSDPHPRWYQAARQLLEQMLSHFSNPAVGFFDTADDSVALLYRPMDIQDNATPSGNALALMLLLKSAAYEGRSDWRLQAERMLAAHLELLVRYPSAFAQWLCASDFVVGPVHEVAIIGELADPATESLLNPLWAGYHPRIVMAASQFPPAAGSPALLNDRPMHDNRPTAYVCQGFVCRLPVTDPAAMLEQLHT